MLSKKRISSKASKVGKRRYRKYTRQMRLKLIDMVINEQMTTAGAAKIIGIKQTSACRIVHNYFKYNRVFEKKDDKVARQKRESQRVKMENLQECLHNYQEVLSEKLENQGQSEDNSSNRKNSNSAKINREQEQKKNVTRNLNIFNQQLSVQKVQNLNYLYPIYWMAYPYGFSF